MNPQFRPFIAFGVAALAACNHEPPTGPITALPRPLTQAEAGLVQADNGFAIGLLRETLRHEPATTNVFVSPLSFAMALGMTYNGASGATETAMQKTLQLTGLTRDQVNASYRSLIDLLRGLDRNVAFTIANSIWYRQEYTFTPSFLETNRTYFDAEVRGLDFASPGAAATVNGWVNDRTEGRIPEIISSPIPGYMIMYLINAIYFHAYWTNRFDPSLTRQAPFFLGDSSTVPVPMMTHGTSVPVRTFYDSTVAVLDLPYSRDAYSMTVVLPRTGLSLDSLAARLTDQRWNGWIAGLRSTSMEVYLPRFTLRYNLDSAVGVLKALGMSPAFCGEPGVDFTRMDPSDSACISEVRHKTFVLVDESGTEAAAATSVGIGVTSAPAAFRVDRPFLFAIRERFSGAILFIGRMMNPAS